MNGGEAVILTSLGYNLRRWQQIGIAPHETQKYLLNGGIEEKQN